jgi:hypothetical protein
VGGVLTNGLYWFAGGLTVTPEGAAISSQDAYEQDYNGNVLLYVLRSEDGGRSWSRVPIVQSRQGRRCSRRAEARETPLGLDRVGRSRDRVVGTAMRRSVATDADRGKPTLPMHTWRLSQAGNRESSA